MDAAFKAMRGSSGTVPERFQAAFGVKWIRQTYYDHFNVWLALTTVNDPTLEAVVQKGQTVAGEWVPFKAKYLKTQPAS
jgi:hypothetical protein